MSRSLASGLRAVFPLMAAVKQPLWPLIDGLQQHGRIVAALAGDAPIVSCRDHDARTSR